eukprot:9479914-Pyramimonas_sp.AAC.1
MDDSSSSSDRELDDAIELVVDSDSSEEQAAMANSPCPSLLNQAAEIKASKVLPGTKARTVRFDSAQNMLIPQTRDCNRENLDSDFFFFCKQHHVDCTRVACIAVRGPRPLPRGGHINIPGGILLAIMWLLLGLNGAPTRVDSVELFAGCRSVTNGVRSYGCSGVALDFKTISDQDDITSTDGFLRALLYVMCLKPGGLLWAAPPCSTWVWIGRKQTGRHHNVLGNGIDCVERANLQ